MKTINSKYAYIENDIITLSDREHSISPIREDCLKDVEITFLENGIIKIKGKVLIYKFAFDGFFVEDNQTEICDNYISQRFDLFRLKKRPYVKTGWYKLNKTKSIEIIKNKYEIRNLTNIL